MTLPRAYAFIGRPPHAGRTGPERRSGLSRSVDPPAAAAHPEQVWEQRRALGRRLASLRSRAGFSQWEFAPLTGYSRSTLSDAELGRHRLRREFWMRCDDALSVGGVLVTAYDQIEAVAAVVRRTTRMQAQRAREEQASQRLKALLPLGAEAPDRVAVPDGVAVPDRVAIPDGPVGRADPVAAADPVTAVEQCPHCHRPVTVMILAAPPAGCVP